MMQQQQKTKCLPKEQENKNNPNLWEKTVFYVEEYQSKTCRQRLFNAANKADYKCSK